MWDFFKLSHIKPEVFSSQKIKMIEHEVWQSLIFPILKKLTKVVVEMLNKWINAGILKPYDRLYWNPWFLVKKKSGVYKIIIAAIKINEVIIKDTNLPPNLDKFTKNFTEISILSLVDYFLKYNNFLNHAKFKDMTAIATSLNLLRQTTLLQKAINSVA